MLSISKESNNKSLSGSGKNFAYIFDTVILHQQQVEGSLLMENLGLSSEQKEMK